MLWEPLSGCGPSSGWAVPVPEGWMVHHCTRCTSFAALVGTSGAAAAMGRIGMLPSATAQHNPSLHLAPTIGTGYSSLNSVGSTPPTTPHGACQRTDVQTAVLCGLAL